MKRILLLLTVATMLATMLALAGPSLAKDSQPKQESYTDRVDLRQYFAKPITDEQDGGSWFRGSATPLKADPLPGLTGALDTSITYTGDAPDSGVTNTLTGGVWMLCSNGFKDAPLDPTVFPPRVIEPECNPEPQMALTGTWERGTAKWDEGAGFATTCLGHQVYAGEAEVEGTLTVSTVNGETVNGIGKFEGTIDHTPLALPAGEFSCAERAPKVKGTLRLTF